MKKKNKKNMVLVTAEGREKSRPPGQLDSEYIHTCKAVVIIQGRVFRDKATPRYFVLWVAVADFFIVGGGGGLVGTAATEATSSATTWKCMLELCVG